MGVDYTPVSGFTVKIPESVLGDAIEDNETDDEMELFDKLELEHATVGCSFSGDTETVLILTPNPKNVDKQIADWLAEVNEALKTSLTVKDVRFISDLHVW